MKDIFIFRVPRDKKKSESNYVPFDQLDRLNVCTRDCFGKRDKWARMSLHN